MGFQSGTEQVFTIRQRIQVSRPLFHREFGVYKNLNAKAGGDKKLLNASLVRGNAVEAKRNIVSSAVRTAYEADRSAVTYNGDVWRLPMGRRAPKSVEGPVAVGRP